MTLSFIQDKEDHRMIFLIPQAFLVDYQVNGLENLGNDTRIWCDYDTIWCDYDMIQYDMIQYDTMWLRYDVITIRYDMIWYDMTQYDMI